MGISSLAGISVILLLIPLTGKNNIKIIFLNCYVITNKKLLFCVCFCFCFCFVFFIVLFFYFFIFLFVYYLFFYLLLSMFFYLFVYFFIYLFIYLFTYSFFTIIRQYNTDEHMHDVFMLKSGCIRTTFSFFVSCKPWYIREGKKDTCLSRMCENFRQATNVWYYLILLI